MKRAPYLRRVQYYETDLMGIVHHSNYIRWFEEARVDYMEQIGYGYHKVEQSGVSMAVLGASCQYKSMVRFGETVRIEMEIFALTPSRMTISYRIYNQSTGELCTTGETSHCFFSRELGRAVSLKKTLPGLYELMASQSLEERAGSPE